MSLVFDTQALLTLYLGEPGGDRVAELLRHVLERKAKGYISVVNLGELYYILARKGRKIAEEKERNLRSFEVRVVPVRDDELWKQAAVMKSDHSLSLADAFAAATAIALGGRLVTGDDPEFDGIKNLKIEKV